LAALVALVALGTALYSIFGGLTLEPRLPLLCGLIALVGVNWRRWLLQEGEAANEEDEDV
jgi:hypothetical protein